MSTSPLIAFIEVSLLCEVGHIRPPANENDLTYQFFSILKETTYRCSGITCIFSLPFTHYPRLHHGETPERKLSSASEIQANEPQGKGSCGASQEPLTEPVKDQTHERGKITAEREGENREQSCDGGAADRIEGAINCGGYRQCKRRQSQGGMRGAAGNNRTGGQ